MELTEKHPLVSVIMAVYNSERYIADAIRSVIAQTYTKWELWIIDDGSADDSVAAAERFSTTDPRIHVLKLSANHGMPYAARNEGTAHSSGKYIAFLDSDDIWSEDKLRLQVELMEDSGAAIGYSSYVKIYESDPGKKKVIQVPHTVNYRDMLRTNYIGNLTSIYNVELLGKLYQKPTMFEDYIMWLEVLKRGHLAKGIDQVLAYYRVHNASVSKNKLRMAAVQWSVYRKYMQLSFFSSVWYLAHYAINGYRKL